MSTEYTPVVLTADTTLSEKRYKRESRDIPKTKIPQGEKLIDVYTYRDALNYAHSVGLLSIKSDLIVELCSVQHNQYLAKATVYFADGSQFDGIGDANPDNVNRMITKHAPRMAETRAVGRALGKALNLDANFKDEFGGDETPEDSVAFSKPATANPAAQAVPAYTAAKNNFNAPPYNDGMGGYACETCGTPITASPKYTAAKKAEMSIKQSGKILCWDCKK